jgi:hypothetical protein
MQELDDLLVVAKEIKLRKGVVVFFDISSVTGMCLSSSIQGQFDQVFVANNIYHSPFYKLTPIQKIIVSVENAFLLKSIMRRVNAARCITGVPLLVFRIARLVCGSNVFFISYIRGIIAKSTEKTSLSSGLYLKVRKLFGVRVASFFSDYSSDKVLCIGDVTRRFVIERSVPDKQVVTIGSIYCDSISLVPSRSLPEGKTKQIVFISSAFSFHGYHESQKAQFSLIGDVMRSIERVDANGAVDFVVRVHPREDLSSYKILKESNIRIDSDQKNPFVAYDDDALFVSPLSTLLFELAYIGKRTRLIASDYFLDSHSDWYRSLSVVPETDIDRVVTSYVSHSHSEYQIEFDLEQIISLKNKGRVLAEFLREVLI